MTKTTSSKRALTASIISLALCFVMLLGTTFAWWSSSASSLVNTVKSGDLAIDLVNTAEASLIGKTLAFVDGETVLTDVLWEPGSSYTVEAVKIKNTGSADIKYKISVVGVAGDSELADVIDWTVAGGAMTGTLASGATSEAIQLTGKMKESAGNQYMNKTADGIAIAVYATQDNDDADFEEVVALIKEMDEVPSGLDVAYTMTPIAGAPEEKYADWNADFVIYFDRDVDAGAVTIGGQYDAWSEDWVIFNNPAAVAEGDEIRLLKDFRNSDITYQEICDIVKEFNCGAASNVSGLKMTVELRLFERVNGVETGNYVTAGAYTYTF